jgi:hypothetical protein
MDPRNCKRYFLFFIYYHNHFTLPFLSSSSLLSFLLFYLHRLIFHQHGEVMQKKELLKFLLSLLLEQLPCVRVALVPLVIQFNIFNWTVSTPPLPSANIVDSDIR